MLELLGALFLAAAGLYTGMTALNDLKIKERQLKEVVGIVERTGIYLSSCRLTTAEIFARLSHENTCYSDLFTCTGTEPAKETSAQMRASGLAYCTEFADYLEDLGSTDLEGELAKNRLFTVEAKTALSQAEDKRKKYSRIYPAAGLSAGLTAALLLL